jgi:hypothetical protein
MDDESNDPDPSRELDARVTPEEPTGEPVLHSLAEFSELILECCELAGARSIVEVGCEWGLTTSALAEWARTHDATVHCVEPYPTLEFRRVIETHPATQLIEELSPAALAAAPPGDVYLLDGDHNYWTVSRELDTAARAAAASGTEPIVFLHDAGWPWGRRDIYYAPEQIPAEAVHPHTFERGVVLGAKDVVDGGFRSGGVYAIALEEGGRYNGVLTAIEDFLERTPGYRFWFVPPVFGLGVLVPGAQPWSDAVSALVERWATHPMLSRLEDNRLRLFLRVLELSATAAGETRRRVEAEAAREEAQHLLETAQAQLSDLERAAAQLATSRWVRGLEVVEAPVRRLRPGLGSVRDRLRAMARRRDTGEHLT